MQESKPENRTILPGKRFLLDDDFLFLGGVAKLPPEPTPQKIAEATRPEPAAKTEPTVR